MSAPAGRQVPPREWALGAILLMLAGFSATAIFDGLFGHPPILFIVRTVAYRLLLAAAGALVRPVGVGVAVAGVSLGWLVLDVLAWTGIFDIYALFGTPFIHFEF